MFNALWLDAAASVSALVRDQSCRPRATACGRSATRASTSCVTSSSVVPRSRFRLNIRSAISAPVRAVEIAGRLVGHQHLAVRRRMRARSPRAAAHRPRAASDSASRRAARPTRASHSRARRAGIGRARELERQHDVFQRSQRGQQLKRLEHETEPALAQRGARVFGQIVQRRVAEPDFAGGRPIEPGEQAQQRRLARSRRADDGNRLAGADVETDASRIVSGASPLCTLLGQRCWRE